MDMYSLLLNVLMEWYYIQIVAKYMYGMVLCTDCCHIYLGMEYVQIVAIYT